MAKVIAPFKIVGTLDEFTFYIDQSNENRVKPKPTGITKEQFRDSPSFQKVKNHGKEFGRAVKKAKTFRVLAKGLNNRAKDGSFAGRANKLMLEILWEDTNNLHGERTFETGIETPGTKDYFVGFEGNKLRPLNKVLKTPWTWQENNCALTLDNFNSEKDIDWPEKADNVHLMIASSNWNYLQNKFETHYSQEIIIQKEEETQPVLLKTEKQSESHLQLLFLFIGFSMQQRKNAKELKRANNTVSIIWSK